MLTDSGICLHGYLLAITAELEGMAIDNNLAKMKGEPLPWKSENFNSMSSHIQNLVYEYKQRM